MAGRPVVDLVVRCRCLGVKAQDVRATVIGQSLPVANKSYRSDTTMAF